MRQLHQKLERQLGVQKPQVEMRIIRYQRKGAGEMTPQLRALTTLSEGPSLVHNCQ